MTYALGSGLWVSLTGASDSWYKLTDHNREDIQVTPELIETQNRMSNGSLRKYVVAQKNKISTSWTFLPTAPTETVDGNRAGAWIEAFYKHNVGRPIYLKVIQSEIDSDILNEVEPAVAGTIPNDSHFRSASTGSKTYEVFITDFSKTLRKRTTVSDYVDINIEFTEI